MTTLSTSTFPDLDLISSGPNLLPPLRLSPTALSEIIETFQRIQNKKDLSLFGTLMGSVNSKGEYLVSSVVCLYYEASISEEDSNFQLQLPNNWQNIIESHQTLFGSKCLGGFLVNAGERDILEGAIIQTISSYMRSKMDSQLANLLLKVQLDPNSPDFKLNAFTTLPNKYFINSFANMREIRVDVDYLPEASRQVHQNLLFYQMQRGDIKNLETQSLEKLTKILDGSIQIEEDEVGISSEEDKLEQVPLSLELLEKLNGIVKQRRKMNTEDSKVLNQSFENDKKIYHDLLSVLEKQVEIARNIAFDESSTKK